MKIGTKAGLGWALAVIGSLLFLLGIAATVGGLVALDGVSVTDSSYANYEALEIFGLALAVAGLVALGIGVGFIVSARHETREPAPPSMPVAPPAGTVYEPWKPGEP